jgi:hypothetical protein
MFSQGVDMSEQAQRYWIAVASKDHVMAGVAGGFMQANHGKRSPLRRVQPGDWIIYYSSKLYYGQEEPCQAFTAVGQIQPGDIYTEQMGNGFEPARRDVVYYDCTEVEIRPLIPQLSFIQDKQRWGYMFRFGFFEITKSDFELITQHMLPERAMSPNK